MKDLLKSQLDDKTNPLTYKAPVSRVLSSWCSLWGSTWSNWKFAAEFSFYEDANIAFLYVLEMVVKALQNIGVDQYCG